MGTSSSKLKKKNRTRSLAWNSVFASVASLSNRARRRPRTASSDPSIYRWPSTSDTNEYADAGADVFATFSTIDDVSDCTDRGSHESGAKSDVGRFRMICSVVELEATFERKTSITTRDGAVCHADADQRRKPSWAAKPYVPTSTSCSRCAALIADISKRARTSMDVKMDEATGSECDSDSTRSKKTLEWELSLDARDLRSHAWYHGAVSRTAAEEIVAERDGDFLVRDCGSQPGNYVLTCRSKGQTLHFVVNKVILQPDTVYESTQYRFEEDSFDTVPDLITYYVGSGKPVTAASDAKIRTPRNRRHPLSWCVAGGCRGQTRDPTRPTGHPLSSPPSSPPTAARPPEGPPRCHGDARLRRDSLRNRRSSRSHSTCGGRVEMTASAPRTFVGSQSPEYANQLAQPPTFSTDHRLRDARRDDDDDERAPGESSPPPPPKPSRAVRQTAAERVRGCAAYTPANRGDYGNGTADSSAHDALVAERADRISPRNASRRRSSSGVVIEHAKYSAVVAGEGCADDGGGGGGPLPAFASSMPRLPSAFDLDNFHTLLLPVAENKPLDADALRALHALLVESGSRLLANHLTRADLRLTVADLGPEYAGCMCATGIELATLPHGRRHRSDLIERTECLKLLVATTILTCDTESERAELLNKWIEVAIDAKTALGNLFGFCAIMLGLCAPQVQRLDETWHILRQKFTDSAFNFEAKLRSTLKSMNESTNPSAPNTTIPHLLPVLLLYEYAFDQVTDGARLSRPHSLHATIDQWETSTPDLGLSTWYAHLDGSRHLCRSLPTFRRNAEIVLSDSKVDELLLDVFRTEFHLKFLWGSRGAMVAAAERHRKFEEVLHVMSEKCESAAVSDAYS